MGIGRFAYTVILPYMQEAEQFSNATAGFLATSNYLGYFVGALIAGKMRIQNKQIPYLRIGMFISIVTTAYIGLTGSYYVWYIVRFISGVISAFIFVVVSSIVLDRLAKEEKTQLSGLFYSGVGLGIMISSLIVSPLHKYFAWNGTWIGLALFSIVLFVFIWLFIQKDNTKVSVQKVSNGPANIVNAPPKEWIPWLIIAYGLEGLGYIVTGTFIVSIAETSSVFRGDATMVWFIVGLAAVPSCLIWAKMAQKIGYVKSLIIAMLLQAFGIVLPAIEENSMMIYTSAFLFGATFMGITTIATTLARRIVPSNSNRILGFITASYAFGQLIGPSLAGILASSSNSYDMALIGASGIVFVGAVCIMNGMKFEQKIEESST